MNQLYIVLISLLFLFSCSSQKLLTSGKYEQAYERSLKKFASNKWTTKDETTLNLALEEIIRKKTSEKDAHINSSEVDGLEKALLCNQDMQKYIENAGSMAFDVFEVELENLKKEEVRLKSGSSKRFFKAGVEKFAEAKDENNKFVFQEAYDHFSKAKKYDFADQENLESYLKASFENGQIVLGLEPEDYDVQFASWNTDNDQFLKIISLDSIEVKECDCLINIQYAYPKTSDNEIENKEEYSREVEDGTETVTETEYVKNEDGERVKVEVEKEITKYKTIEAKMIITETERVSKGSVDVLVDPQNQNCTVKQTCISREVSSSIREVKIKGDKDAITGDIPSEDGLFLDSRSKMERKVSDMLQGLVYDYLVSYGR